MPSTITDEELATCRQAFAQFDLDRSGSISLEELKIGFDKMTKEKNITRKTLKYLIEMFDITGDNELQFFELVFLMKSKEWEMIMNSESSRFSLGSDLGFEETKTDDEYEGNRRFTVTPRTFEAKRCAYTGETFAKNLPTTNVSPEFCSISKGDKEIMIDHVVNSSGRKTSWFFGEEEKHNSFDDKENEPKEASPNEIEENGVTQTVETKSVTTKPIHEERKEEMQQQPRSLSVRQSIALFQGQDNNSMGFPEESHGLEAKGNTQLNSLSQTKDVSDCLEVNKPNCVIDKEIVGNQISSDQSTEEKEKQEVAIIEDFSAASENNQLSDSLQENQPETRKLSVRENIAIFQGIDKPLTRFSVDSFSTQAREDIPNSISDISEGSDYSEGSDKQAPLQPNDFLFPICLDDTRTEHSDQHRDFSHCSSSDNPLQMRDFLTPVCMNDKVVEFKQQFARMTVSEKAGFIGKMNDRFQFCSEERDKSDNSGISTVDIMEKPFHDENDQIVNTVTDEASWVSFKKDAEKDSCLFCSVDPHHQNCDCGEGDKFHSTSIGSKNVFEIGTTKTISFLPVNLQDDTCQKGAKHHWTDDIEPFAALHEESTERCVIQLEVYNHNSNESPEKCFQKVMHQPIVALKGVKQLLRKLPRNVKGKSNTTAYSKMREPKLPRHLYEC
mmetsp:Transcript_7613/g.11632  ORF Transcript_7613/g.11632 Transcript_7613/m.11632 type:complete len:670 (+) Transcript_7613:73-2082(+)